MRRLVPVDWLARVCAGVSLMIAMVVQAAEPAAEVVFLGRTPTLTGIDEVLARPLEAARSHHSIAVYPLGDLLKKGRDVSKLIHTMQSTVTPDAWDVAGGEAFIRAFRAREKAAPSCLVVRQTSAGHRAVGDFLKQLPP